MSKIEGTRLALAAAGIAVPLLLPLSSGAQQGVPAQGVSAPGFSSRPIFTSPVTGDDAKEIVVISAEIAPGASSPAHSHPGHCVVTVQAGVIELRIEGKESRRLIAGEAFVNPPGPIHQFYNVGDTPARLTQVLLVEKGKPRTVTFPTPLK